MSNLDNERDMWADIARNDRDGSTATPNDHEPAGNARRTRRTRRYEPTGAWVRESFTDAGAGNVVVHVCDVIEARSGHVWHAGAWRVSITGPTGRPRGRTFIGESAWCQAESYARDAVRWLQMWDGARS